ncbi:hypothetical protein [Luteitalea pratensis]|nr:hypothetical protein [Luteitalea pratensis]
MAVLTVVVLAVALRSSATSDIKWPSREGALRFAIGATPAL